MARATAPALVAPGDILAVSYFIATADPNTTYTLEPGDELYLNFRYSPELSQIYMKQLDDKDRREDKTADKVSILSRAYVVQPDGSIVLTGIREPLKVAGLGTRQVAGRVEALYKKSGMLSQPDVGVTVDPQYKRYAALKSTIQSEGERPIIYLPVPADGRISLPLAAGVQVAGKTVEAIGKELTERYRAQGLPLVTVNAWFHQVGGKGGARVRVLGEVQHPGVYYGPASLWDAVALAGGFTAGADVNGVRVVGKGGKAPLGIFRFDDTLQNADPKADPALADGDLIYVPRLK
jgi:protein involved in polysaccharide export with SLBB domain